MFESRKSYRDTRVEFERELNILLEMIKSGKMRFAQGMNIEKSLMSARFAPNGRIDLLTINSAVRSMAMMVDRKQWEKEEEEEDEE